MADAGVLRQLDHGIVQCVKNPVGSFDVVVRYVLPDVVDILFGARRKDKPLHPLPRFRSALRLRISANTSSPPTNSPRLAAQAKRRGTPLPIIDGLLAATALHYNLTVVTRNAGYFTNAQVQVLNPWKA
jgi:predicted nucleic acid-binding protein